MKNILKEIFIYIKMKAVELFNFAKNAIVTISCEPGSVGNNKVSSGFIYKIKKCRAYIVTCAHSVLLNEGAQSGPLDPVTNTYPTPLPNPSISCTMTNVVDRDGKCHKNIAVSLGVLGMDIASDIAVLFTYKPDEVTSDNPFGFLFSRETKHLHLGELEDVPNGSKVGIIDNLFNVGLSMNSGTCGDNDFILAPGNSTFVNYQSQILCSISVDTGSSGSPILISNGRVVGIAAYMKNEGQYVGGPNVVTLRHSLEKIFKLNKCVDMSVNFDGNTGAGYLGIISYFYINDQTNKILLNNYSTFAPYATKVKGLVITGVNTNPVIIPNSQIVNAQEYDTGSSVGIFAQDIVLKVNNRKLGLYNHSNINFASYYDSDDIVYLEILRPSTGNIMKFKVIPDKWPINNNYVSTDPSIITLITNIGTSDIFEAVYYNGNVAGTLTFKNTYQFMLFGPVPPGTMPPTFRWYVTNYMLSYSTGGTLEKIVYALGGSNPGRLNYLYGLVFGQVNSFSKTAEGDVIPVFNDTYYRISFYSSDGGGQAVYENRDANTYTNEFYSNVNQTYTNSTTGNVEPIPFYIKGVVLTSSISGQIIINFILIANDINDDYWVFPARNAEATVSSDMVQKEGTSGLKPYVPIPLSILFPNINIYY